MSVQASQLIAKVGAEGVEATQQKLRDVGQTAKETSGGFKSMLGNALSFASGQAVFNMVGQAVGFLKNQVSDSINMAMQHNDVLAQTDAVLRSTHDASGMTAKSVQDLAQSIQDATGANKDITMSGEDLLLTFTNISKDVFPQTTNIMLAMSKAMGQDVKSSALQLGKALDDPLQGLNALKRVGVTFSAQEEEQIKTMMAHNDIVGAQKVMLGELNTEFGKSLTEGVSPFTRSMQILQGHLSDFKEEIGEAVIPILSDLVQNFAAPALQDAQNIFHGIGDAASYVGNVLKTVSLREFNDAWRDTQAVMRDIETRISSGLAPTLRLLKTDADPVADTIGNLARGGLSIITGLLRDFETALMGVDRGMATGKGPLNDLLSGLKSLASPFKDAAKSALDLVGPALNLYSAISPLHLVFSEAGNIISQVLPPALDIGKQVFDGLKDIISSLSPVVSGDLEPAIKGLADAIIPIIAHTLEWIDKSGIIKIALGAVKDIIVPLGVVLSGLINGLTSVIKFFTQTQLGADILKAALITLAVPLTALAAVAIVALIAAIPGMIAGFIAGAGAAWTMAAAVIGATWPILAIIAVITGVILAIQHWGDIVNWLKGAWGDVSSFFGGIFGDIASWFGGIGQWFHDRFTEAYNGIKNALGAVGGWVHDNLVAPFENGLARIGGVFQAIAKLIGDATSFNWGAIPGDLHNLHIPGFADGTSFAPGGWSLVGEEGPEIRYIPRGAQIFPASQTAQMLSGGTSSGAGQPIILIMDGRVMARGVMPHIVNEVRNNVGVRF